MNANNRRTSSIEIVFLRNNGHYADSGHIFSVTNRNTDARSERSPICRCFYHLFAA